MLEFRSNNTVHRPVIEALTLIRRYATAGNLTYYPLRETVPEHRGTSGDWSSLIYRTDTRGRERERVARTVYEVATFQALRELLRCKEIWVAGAEAWRHPEQDLPADFDQRRQEHFRELRKPLDPSVFIDQLCTEMTTALEQLDDALPGLDWLEVTGRASAAKRMQDERGRFFDALGVA
jgi:hypothetical protein